MMWFNTRPTQWIEATTGPMGLGYQFQKRFMHYRPIIPLFWSHFLLFSWWLVSFVCSLIERLDGSDSVQGTEGVRTFGQILALLMTGLPFLTAVELFFGVYFSKLSAPTANPVQKRRKRQKLQLHPETPKIYPIYNTCRTSILMPGATLTPSSESPPDSAGSSNRNTVGPQSSPPSCAIC